MITRSFSVVDRPGILTDREDDMLSCLLAHEEVVDLHVRGRNADGEVVVKATTIESGSGITVLISDEADGAKVSVDGIVFVPTLDRILL